MSEEYAETITKSLNKLLYFLAESSDEIKEVVEKVEERIWEELFKEKIIRKIENLSSIKQHLKVKRSFATSFIEYGMRQGKAIIIPPPDEITIKASAVEKKIEPTLFSYEGEMLLLAKDEDIGYLNTLIAAAKKGFIMISKDLREALSDVWNAPIINYTVVEEVSMADKNPIEIPAYKILPIEQISKKPRHDFLVEIKTVYRRLGKQGIQVEVLKDGMVIKDLYPTKYRSDEKGAIHEYFKTYTSTVNLIPKLLNIVVKQIVKYAEFFSHQS